MRRWASCICVALVASGLSGGPATALDHRPRIVRDPVSVAPVFVSGIDEAPVDAPPVRAALAHLDRRLYGLDDPARDLEVLETMHHGPRTAVRFGQVHAGVPVWGAQYIVHLDEETGGLSTETVNGHLFTELEVRTAPTLDLDQARSALDVALRTTDVEEVNDEELVVLPLEGGVLTYSFQVEGSHLGNPMKRQIFVDAHTGRVVLSLDDLHKAGAAVGRGTTSHGEKVRLDVYERRDRFEMRDRSKPMYASSGGEIRTHDVAGSLYYFASPGNLVTSQTLTFPSGATRSGAVDAHYGASKVYDFFHALGRNSIDDAGGDIVSSVNATENGLPLYNAYWDGEQMVYGNPDPERLHPLSADLDIVGHELTHGVTQHSGDLAYIGQSGAMNEAYSDYFGNAIDVDGSGMAMTAPDASLIGEDVCRTRSSPEWECPLRDLDDGTTTDDFIFFLADLDQGGVHLNSTIYGGALWDIREALGSTADRYIYAALTRFTTPLQDFVDGRNAILAAANELQAPPEHVQAIERAFDSRGIVEGWDAPVSQEGQILVENVAPLTTTTFSPPQVSGERFVIGDYKNKRDMCCGSLELYVGRTDGSGGLRKVGDDSRAGTYTDEWPDISGRRVTWMHWKTVPGGLDIVVRSRKLGRRPKTVASGRGQQMFPSLDGNLIAWEDNGSGDSDIRVRYVGKKARFATRAGGDQYLPQVFGDWVAWWDLGGRGPLKIGLKNMKTGKEVTIRGPSEGIIGPPTLGPKGVYWYEDADYDRFGSIMSARFDGRGQRPLVRESHPDAPMWAGFAQNPPVVSANGSHAAFSSELRYVSINGLARDEIGRDIWVVPLAGGDPEMLTTNRADQAYPALGPSGRVLWLDSGRGTTDLLTKQLP